MEWVHSVEAVEEASRRRGDLTVFVGEQNLIAFLDLAAADGNYRLVAGVEGPADHAGEAVRRQKIEGNIRRIWRWSRCSSTDCASPRRR